jgi:hypothetical protein
MSKDINIPVNLPGAKEAESDLQKLTAAIKELTEQTKKSAQANSDNVIGTDRQSGSFAGLKKVVESVTGELRSMVGAWLGLRGIEKLLDSLADKMQRIQSLQKQVYQQSLQLQDIGQGLEFQTGTIGQQNQWAQMAIDLQKAGGLKDVSTAQQMMISADIAFGASGGIKSPQVQSLVKQIAPFFGTSQIASSEIAKVFDFAQTAGIASTPEAWQQYLSQLQAGFTASKATNFGQFMEGLQKGATPYISAGGSFTEAVSLFSGARAVTANEAMAGTLLEQITRLSGGAMNVPVRRWSMLLGLLGQVCRWTSVLLHCCSTSTPFGIRSGTMDGSAGIFTGVNHSGISHRRNSRNGYDSGHPIQSVSHNTCCHHCSAAGIHTKQCRKGTSNTGRRKSDGVNLWRSRRRISTASGSHSAAIFRKSVKWKNHPGVPDSYEPYVMLARELMDDLQTMGPLSGEQEQQRTN